MKHGIASFYLIEQLLLEPAELDSAALEMVSSRNGFDLSAIFKLLFSTRAGTFLG
jgi:hypothetical protein